MSYRDDDDQQRFEHETGQEAHYWFTVCAFVDLSIEHGLDKLLKEVIHLREHKLKGLTK